MMRSAITISLVPETKGGPFVFWDGLADGFARAAKLGFDAVEIFPPSAEDLAAREIKKLCTEHNLKIAAIGTGAGWVKHKLRLTDPDATVRRRAQEFIAAIVDFAGSFGAPAILGSMQGRWEGGVSREQAIAWLAEALEQLGPRAHAAGVPFLYEFLNRYETNLFNNVAGSLEFLQTLRTQNVKLLGDLFHMNIEEADIAAALRLAGPKLGHVHFADSNRRAVGLGHTDMKPVMAALREIGYDGYLSAEVLALPDSEAAARQTMASFRSLVAG
ncbi:MAG: sugar phosphate isomerase/epimerase [Verrucomicrobia bacterium]|nr:sugar phosphate isomerase/epimerase [Verrucomicrobiota bacterium]